MGNRSLEGICKTRCMIDTYLEETTEFDEDENAKCKHCGANDLWLIDA